MGLTPGALDQLADFHARVHDCTRCFNAHGCAMERDAARVPRRLPRDLVNAEIMIVGEALGPSTQRLSGLPYVEPGGEMRTAGRTLDAFLSEFGYTVRPGRPGRYVYSTDLIRCFPHDTAAPPRVRRPTAREVENCALWLDEELRLIRPRVVILLGLHATRAFFRAYCQRDVRALGDVAGGPHWTDVSGDPVAVFAVPHPSPAAAGPGRAQLYRAVARSVAKVLADSRP